MIRDRRWETNCPETTDKIHHITEFYQNKITKQRLYNQLSNHKDHKMYLILPIVEKMVRVTNIETFDEAHEETPRAVSGRLATRLPAKKSQIKISNIPNQATTGKINNRNYLIVRLGTVINYSNSATAEHNNPPMISSSSRNHRRISTLILNLMPRGSYPFQSKNLFLDSPLFLRSRRSPT